MHPNSQESVLELQHNIPQYTVVMHNDDYTTMEFVVAILHTIFHHALDEATRLMDCIHTGGATAVGAYAYDIAVTKVKQVHDIAQENGFPLRCTVEESYES